VSWTLDAGEHGQPRAGPARAVDLAVSQACLLRGVEGALILVPAAPGVDALRVVAGAGDGEGHRGALVDPDTLDQIGADMQVAVREGDGTRLGTLAIMRSGEAAGGAELHDALRGLAALAGLGWRGPERAIDVDRVFEAGVTALAGLLDLRDGYIAGHAEEVVALCEAIARHLRLPATALRQLEVLAHYARARPVDPQVMLHAAVAAGLSPQQLRALMFDMSCTDAATPRATEPSPLSRTQTTVLRGLAEGKIYKEIASDMGLPASTVRTHCHDVYRKLGVSDRSQAQLHATARGWL
jgi:DNA-binding CsgD family transcriptional regulator